jgi:hypothetical protein
LLVTSWLQPRCIHVYTRVLCTHDSSNQHFPFLCQACRHQETCSTKTCVNIFSEISGLGEIWMPAYQFSLNRMQTRLDTIIERIKNVKRAYCSIVSPARHIEYAHIFPKCHKQQNNRSFTMLTAYVWI